MRKLRELSLRDLLAVGLPAIALILAGFWFASRFIQPAPPDYFVMATGADGGIYQVHAARYRDVLRANGIELRERTSAGSIENLKRLLDPDDETTVAFVQGGTGQGTDEGVLRSLGALYHEPLWVFYRGKTTLTTLDQLKHRRIAIGPEGSGTRKLALDVLNAHGMASGAARLLPVSGISAVEQLRRGEVDAVMLVGGARSAAVWTALYTDGVRLMSMAEADAYVRQFPHLARLELPAGAIDLQRKIPVHDTTLVGPMATLVVRDDFHPALIDMLLQAAAEVHGAADLFQTAGEFPRRTPVDFPLSKEAERYYRSGKPFLQRYLPFWAATFIDRVVVMLIPLVAVLIPVLKIAPQFYSWRVRSRVYRWYGELKFLEGEVEKNPSARTQAEWLEKLASIEHGVEHIRTPLPFADFVYTLRMHVGLVREIILRKTSTQ